MVLQAGSLVLLTFLTQLVHSLSFVKHTPTASTTGTTTGGSKGGARAAAATAVGSVLLALSSTTTTAALSTGTKALGSRAMTTTRAHCRTHLTPTQYKGLQELQRKNLSLLTTSMKSSIPK